MRLIPKTNITVIVFILITLLLGCGDDDKIINNDTVDIFARLSISRFHPSQGGLLVITDSIFASYDTVYSPILPEQPFKSIDVICNNYQLEWNQDINQHFYTDFGSGLGFLQMGGTYIFKTAADQEVPPFEKSIKFPTEQPTIMYPRWFNYGSGIDTISIANGFTITWTNAGVKEVELIICDGSVEGYHPVDTLFHFLKENDGAFSLGPAELIGFLTSDEMYKIILILKNREPIVIEGYDSRSYIMAQYYTISHFYAM